MTGSARTGNARPGAARAGAESMYFTKLMPVPYSHEMPLSVLLGVPRTVPKVRVVEREDYSIWLETVRPSGAPHLVFTFAHADVNVKWTRSVRDRFYADFDDMRDLRDGALFAAVDLDDAKLHKFVRLLGFEFYGSWEAADGRLCHIYIF